MRWDKLLVYLVIGLFCLGFWAMAGWLFHVF